MLVCARILGVWGLLVLGVVAFLVVVLGHMFEEWLMSVAVGLGELFIRREMYIYTVADCRCREINEQSMKLYILLVRNPTALPFMAITKYDELLSQ